MQGLAALGSMFVGWGVRFADFDNDGDNDVVISNGHAIRYPAGSGLAQLPLLLENRGTQFLSVGKEAGGYFAQPHRGRGLAAGDLNADGKLDVVFSNVNEAVACLRNDTPGDGYLRVRLIGRESNRDGIGARVELKSRERTQSAQVIGGGSYASSSEKTVHFGVEHGSQPLELKVQWPSGRTQSISVDEIRRELLIVEAGEH
jgi:hypothetical protein